MLRQAYAMDRVTVAPWIVPWVVPGVTRTIHVEFKCHVEVEVRLFHAYPKYDGPCHFVAQPRYAGWLLYHGVAWAAPSVFGTP